MRTRILGHAIALSALAMTTGVTLPPSSAPRTAGAVLLGSVQRTVAVGPLQVLGSNPRYFTDGSGNAVYLTGSHTWSNFQDSGWTDPPAAFDFTAHLDWLEQRNHNFFRLWAWEETFMPGYFFSPGPAFVRTGPGNALDGKLKFDLAQVDQAYFDRLRARVIEARDRGFYVSVMLFNGFSTDAIGAPGNDSWPGHPLNVDNNINGIDGDPNNDNSGAESHTLADPAITTIHENYVRKVIDTVNDLDNVLYEISNESRTDSQDWQYHIINFIKAYEATLPKQHPVGMTVEWPSGSNAELYASPADWISPNGSLSSPPVADGSKVILLDTDHLCGICGDGSWVWKSFTRGSNPIFMDVYDGDNFWTVANGDPDPNSASFVSARDAMGYTRWYAERMDLASLTPQGGLSSTDYCLANTDPEAAEYLVYRPSATGNISVDLSATQLPLNVEWFRPATGDTIQAGMVAGGSTINFTPPFTGDAVLYLSTDLVIWSIQIDASLGAARDANNFVGAAVSATNGFDADLDFPEPPASPGDYIRLFFERPEWSSILGDEFGTDFRPEVNLIDSAQVWEFDVVSNVGGAAYLKFTFRAVPGVPVILQSVDNGQLQNVSDGDSVAVNLSADVARRFRLFVGDSTPPNVQLGSAMSGPSILPAGATANLTWTSDDGYMIESTRLSFSPDSGRSWTTVAELTDETAYSWTVPDSALLFGASLRLEVTDFAGNSATSQSSPVFAIAGDSLSTPVRQGWSLWGPALDARADSVTANLEDDFTSYWVAYGFSQGGYEFGGVLEPTNGYWLGSLSPSTIDLSGRPLTADTTISVPKGWVLLSNPLVLDIARDSLLVSRQGSVLNYPNAVNAGWVNSMYGYSGTAYEGLTAIESWTGFWLGVLLDGVSITFPVHAGSGPSSAKNNAAITLASDWQVDFEAVSGGARDITATIGAAEGATADFDSRFDEIEPPLPASPDYVSLYVNRPDVDQPLGDGFSRDIREPVQSTTTWPLVLESTGSRTVVSWTLVNVPEDLRVELETDGGRVNMREQSQVELNGDATFLVHVTTGSGVATDPDSDLPSTFDLRQNYPNPFNPVTNISFDVPYAAHVTITVHDVLGRLVRVLSDEERSAGTHTVTWNASGYGSGLYIYKMTSGEFGAVRSMLLLK